MAGKILVVLCAVVLCGVLPFVVLGQEATVTPVNTCTPAPTATPVDFGPLLVEMQTLTADVSAVCTVAAVDSVQLGAAVDSVATVAALQATVLPDVQASAADVGWGIVAVGAVLGALLLVAVASLVAA